MHERITVLRDWVPVQPTAPGQVPRIAGIDEF